MKYLMLVTVIKLRIIGGARRNTFNPLALELEIYSLAHHLCKM